MDNHEENAGNVGDVEETQIESPPTLPTSVPEVGSVNPNPNPNVLSGGNAENVKNQGTKNNTLGVINKFKGSASRGAQVATNTDHQLGIHTSIGQVQQLNLGSKSEIGVESVKHSNAITGSNPKVPPLYPNAVDPYIREVLRSFNPGKGTRLSSKNTKKKKSAKTIYLPDFIRPSNDDTKSGSTSKTLKPTASNRTTIGEIVEPLKSGTGSAGSNSRENGKLKEKSIKTRSPAVVPEPLNPGTGSGSNTEKLKSPESIKTSTSKVLALRSIPGSESRSTSEKVKLLRKNIKTSISDVVPSSDPDIGSGLNAQNLNNAETVKDIISGVVSGFNPEGTGSEGSNFKNEKQTEDIKTNNQDVLQPIHSATVSGQKADNVKPSSGPTGVPEAQQYNCDAASAGLNAGSVKHPDSIMTSIAEVLLTLGSGIEGLNAEDAKNSSSITSSVVPNHGVASGLNIKKKKHSDSTKISSQEVLRTVNPGSGSLLNAANAKHASSVIATVPKFWPCNPSVASGLSADQISVKQKDSTKISIPEVPPFINPGAGAELNGKNVKDDPKSINTSAPEVVQFISSLFENNIPVSGSGLDTQNATCVNTSFPEVRAPFNPDQGLSGVNIQNVNENNSKPCFGSSSNSNKQEQEDLFAEKAPDAPEVEIEFIENIADVLGPERTTSLLFQGSENEHMARNFIDQMDFIERNVPIYIRPGPAAAPPPAPAPAPGLG